MNTDLLLKSLSLMGKGMLAIFTVSIAIYICVKLLTAFGARKKGEQDA